MKTIKRIFMLIMAVMLVVTASLGAFGEAAAYYNRVPKELAESGDCGSGVEWSFNSDTGLLDIYGDGYMADYNSLYGTESPFEGVDDIREIYISSGVKSIGNEAFENCGSLESVTIEEGVMEIGSWAFDNCYKLKSITIPESMSRIGMYAFSNCKNIEDLYIDSASSWCEINFDGTDSNPMSCTEKEVFVYVADSFGEANITIDGAGIDVPSYAFRNCINYSSVTIASGVKSIGYEAFGGCSDFESITFLNDNCTIHNNAINTDVTIYGRENSIAQKYAENNRMKFVLIDEDGNPVPEHIHTEITVEGKAATCTESGLTDGIKCSECDEVIEEQTEIPAFGHTEATIEAVAATYTKTGLTEGTMCSECGEVTKKQKKVSKKKLKKVTLSSAKSTKKKTANITWKKVTDASGYIVEYSTSKKFTKKTTKTVKIKKGKTVKATLKKLKSGKKYYVRVKAYRTEGKKTVYGSYSTVKTMKIK